MKPFEMKPDYEVSLIVNQDDLRGDDRWSAFVTAIGGDTMTISDIAAEANITIDEALTSATLLWNEGYLEL